jgi:anti-sigma regulatory factor (Ser/Thr protein kinase)
VSEPSDETVPLCPDHGDGPACLGQPDWPLCPGQPDWPLSTFAEFGALPSAVRAARQHAMQALLEWGLIGLGDAIELIISELVTNAIRASSDMAGHARQGQSAPRTSPVRLWLRSDRKRVLILVWDASELMPTRQDVDLAAESGRGLLLVEVLSVGWGSYVPTDGRGKVTWAVVADGH